MQRGEIPITKNIIVIDEQGKVFEATYPKRAMGLVKKGRAQFVDSNTICLVRPPTNINNNIDDRNIKNISEDNIMEYAQDNTNIEIFSLENILNRIDSIINADEYFKETILSVKDIEAPDRENEFEIISEKCNILARMVEQRENTNRRAIEFLERMYEGLKPERTNNLQIKALEMIENITSNGNISDDARQQALDRIDSIRFLKD